MGYKDLVAEYLNKKRQALILEVPYSNSDPDIRVLPKRSAPSNDFRANLSPTLAKPNHLRNVIDNLRS